MNRQSEILHLTIRDLSALYAAYMPYLQRGGLFIPTGESHDIGDEVVLLLKLLDEPERIPVNGAVVWVTPLLAQVNSRSTGIGVHFSEGDAALATRIENHLAAGLPSVRHTQTM